uniref:Uncharacterized protein n=1 Tax=Rhizophora mucronata TaxID=61149 RepID=A0A2P2N6G2_RHIMU
MGRAKLILHAAFSIKDRHPSLQFCG